MTQLSGLETWVVHSLCSEQRTLEEVWAGELAVHLRHTTDDGDELRVGEAKQGGNATRQCAQQRVRSGARWGRRSEPRQGFHRGGWAPRRTVEAQPCYGVRRESGVPEDKRTGSALSAED